MSLKWEKYARGQYHIQTDCGLYIISFSTTSEGVRAYTAVRTKPQGEIIGVIRGVVIADKAARDAARDELMAKCQEDASASGIAPRGPAPRTSQRSKLG